MGKIKRILTLFISSISLTIGVFAGGYLLAKEATTNNETDIKEVKAESLNGGGIRVYFTINYTTNGQYIWNEGIVDNLYIYATWKNSYKSESYPGPAGIRIIKNGAHFVYRDFAADEISYVNTIQLNNGDSGSWQGRIDEQDFQSNVVENGYDTFVVNTNEKALWAKQSGYWMRLSDCENRPKKIYIDISQSIWNGWSGSYDDLWVRFFNDISRYSICGNGSNGANEKYHWKKVVNTDSSKPSTKFVDNEKVRVVNVPWNATYMQVSVWPTDNTNQNHSVDLTIPTGADKNKNLLVVNSANGSAKQTAVFVKPFFDANYDTIYFKFKDTILASYSNILYTNLRVYYYGTNFAYGNDSFGIYDDDYSWRHSGTSEGRDYVSGETDYKVFDVPDWAVYVIFCTQWDDASQIWQTSSGVALKSNERRVYTLGSQEKAEGSTYTHYLELDSGSNPVDTLETRPAALDESNYFPVSNKTKARMFINNTAYGGLDNGLFRNTEFYCYAVRCWTDSLDNLFIPNGNISSNVYYCSTWFNGGGTEQTDTESSESVAHRYYTYVDIPLTTRYVQIILVMDNYMKYACSDILSITANSYSECYFVKAIKGNCAEVAYEGEIIEAAKASTQRVGTQLMTYVLNAYTTCSDSQYNGCGAVSRLKSNFYINPNSDTQNAMITTLEGGEDPEHNPYTQSINDTILIMESRLASSHYPGAKSSLNNPFGITFDRNGYEVIIIIVASSVALLSITALSVLVVKKRKTR